MKIYFIRHAESEYNVKHLINSDPTKKIGLTANGKNQAVRAAEKLKSMRFDAIYSSPFLRAMETAEILKNKLGTELFFDERLGEIKIGHEGKGSKYYFEMVKKFLENPKFREDGHESYSDVKKRLQDFLEDARKKKTARIIVVTHEMVVIAARALFNELGDKDTLTTPVPNAEPIMFDL